jgi:hypothetical protein
MRYAAAQSVIVDSYRAGADVGEQVASASPEVIVVFCTIHYGEGLKDLVDGVKDAVGKDVIVFGCTGDGIYGRDGVINHGVCALAISSEGKARWATAIARGVSDDSFSAAAQAAREICTTLGGEPTFSMVFADGVKADGSMIVEGVSSILHVPYFGGLAADDRKLERTFVVCDGVVAQDAVCVLAAVGDLPHLKNVGSGWSPVGRLGTVTKADGCVVSEIDGLPAGRFIQSETGRSMRQSDLGIIPLAEYIDETRFALRTSAHMYDMTEALRLFGRIPQGAQVRICRATMDEIIGGVEEALAGVRAFGSEPAAVIVVSCAARKWLLTENGSEEVARVRRVLGDLPLIGFPSFGEISPLRSFDGKYSKTMFHNATFVVIVLFK